MPTECTSDSLHVQAAHGRDVVARFEGGTLTSDAGAFLLREAEREAQHAAGILRQFASCLADHRDPARVGTWRITSRNGSCCAPPTARVRAPCERTECA